MSRTDRLLPLLLVSATLAGTPAPAVAQEVGTSRDPVAELSVGYVFMQDDVDDFPTGAYVSGAATLNQWLAVVGEFGASYTRPQTFSVGSSESVTDKRRVYTVLAGPRFHHRTGRVAPFVQFLTGYAPLRLEQVTSPAAPSGSTHTYVQRTSAWAFQPGGGVTVSIVEHLAIRGEVDYRWSKDWEDDGGLRNGFRVLSGVVWQWSR